MTNPVNIVPKSDNDGSQIGKQTSRWTEAHLIDIKSQVIHFISKAISPTNTTNAIYVKDGQLFFEDSIISGVSDEYIQGLIDTALSTIDFVSEAEAGTIASTIATNIVNTAINSLSIPSNLSDLDDVDVSGIQSGDVVTWNGTNFVMQAPNDVVNNTLSLSDGTNNNSLDLANSDVLTIQGTNGEVDVQLTSGVGGLSYTIALPSNINAKSSSSVQADKLTTARTVSLSGDADGSVSFDGSQNVSLLVSSVKATQLKTARTISLSGNASGIISFDGTSNVDIPTTVNLSSQANTLSTARTITISGDAVNQGVPPSFNGSANITIPITVSKSDKIRTARKITLSGDAAGAVNFDGSADVVLNTTVTNSSTANQLALSKTISLTGPVTGSVSTNFSSNPSIATTIPANSFKTILTAKVTSLLYRDKSSGGNLPASSNTFNTALPALLAEPVAVFLTQTGEFSSGHRVVGAYLYFQDGGVPGVSSNGVSRRIYEDYEFILKSGTVSLTGETTWGSTVATGYMLRSTPDASTYDGQRTDVSAVLVPPTGSTNVSSGSVLGLFFKKTVFNYAGFTTVESNLNPCAYGCTINVVLENLPLQA
jgi:hypothetical protein